MARRLRTEDGRAIAVLVVLLALVTVVTWRRWGLPFFDAGLDLTVADGIVHGKVPYSDSRYYYGPLGLYSLAGAFAVFGSSLAVAFVFGYVQTVAILASFYALARTWLPATAAAVATTLLMAVAFTGSFFDYVLPHTNAGTFGCLLLILQVLAVTRGRYLLCGVAAGLLCLTRVEFVLFAAAVAGGALLGVLRESGVRPTLRAAVTIAVPSVLVPVAVYTPFALDAGLHRLVFDNLVPVDFARFGGAELQRGWAPLDVSSLVATAARGAIVLGLAAGLVLSVDMARTGRGLRSAWPLVAALGSLAVAAALWRLSGVFPGARGAVTDEAKRLLLAMSWLPIPAVVALAWALRRAARNEPAPGAGWPADLALLAGAAAAGLRAYNEFTPDSYAPYWAALPALVAVIVAQRVALHRPAARVAALAVPAVAAAALFLHAYVGLYSDDTATVSTPRGTFRWFEDGGPALERTTRYVARRLEGREPILSFPADPGVHFLSGHPSALYESTFPPGTLDSEADERRAIRVLRRRPAELVVIAAQRTDNYGFSEIGVDYTRILFGYLRANYRPAATFGDVNDPERDSRPGRAFTVWERR